jgi:hypothetical protein
MSNIIADPTSINKEGINQLNEIIKEFPYFHTGQLLLCKGLHNIDSIRFKTQLSKAASYAANRKVLFQLINKQQNKKTKKTIHINNELIKDEYHSFIDWLSIIKTEKIDRSKNMKSNQIIDIFIKNQPNLSRNNKQEFFKSTDIGKKSIIENKDLITETLAKVYTKQQHFDKAISVYQKLSLKYPQKSSYFADQIKLITKLKNK